MTDLEAYYNKFNEEKRLDSRHGRVEFVTSKMCIRDRPKIGYVGKGQLVVYDNMGVYVYDLSSSDPVSYTHLDVYKRQAVSTPIGSVFGFQLSFLSN